MAGIELYVKDEEEKAKLIASYLEPDNQYLEALSRLREELIRQRIDIESPEGKRIFIKAVRELNRSFCSSPDNADSCAVKNHY